MKTLNSQTTKIEESIFSQMSAKARSYGAVNLSQGFPDFSGPEFHRQAYKSSIEDNALNQYAPMPGLPRLTKALQNYYKNEHNLDYQDDEITIANGATQCIFNSALSCVNPGDEVIIIEPFYDSYPAVSTLAQAKIKTVTLHAPEYRWNLSELEQAFSDKTKLVFFNNPHNPSGRVFSKEELNELASLCQKYDSYIISDEVYEHLCFDGNTHIPMATIDGMKERTYTISSGAKTFGHTGWKVGWMLAPKEMTKAFRRIHQFNVFSVNANAQFAMSEAIKNIESYKSDFIKLYSKKRDKLLTLLDEHSLEYLKPQGTYFVLAKLPTWAVQKNLNDLQYTNWLIENSAIAIIPTSPFYLGNDQDQPYIRFCFAKKDETLEKAAQYLKTKKGFGP